MTVAPADDTPDCDSELNATSIAMETLLSSCELEHQTDEQQAVDGPEVLSPPLDEACRIDFIAETQACPEILTILETNRKLVVSIT